MFYKHHLVENEIEVSNDIEVFIMSSNRHNKYLVGGVLQMSFARWLQDLPPMQYTVTRNKQDFTMLNSKGGALAAESLIRRQSLWYAL